MSAVSEIPLVGGGGSWDQLLEKWLLGVPTLVGVFGILVWQCIAASIIWHEHNTKRVIPRNDPDYRDDKQAHRLIMPTIIISIIAIAIMTSSISLRSVFGLMKGFSRLGIVRFVSAGILIGIIILNFNLRARYRGELVYIDADSARCPDGKIIEKIAANKCKLNVNQCSNLKEASKLRDIWLWWEIPALSAGGALLAVAWLAYIYMVVKSGGFMLRQ